MPPLHGPGERPRPSPSRGPSAECAAAAPLCRNSPSTSPGRIGGEDPAKHPAHEEELGERAHGAHEKMSFPRPSLRPREQPPATRENTRAAPAARGRFRSLRSIGAFPSPQDGAQGGHPRGPERPHGSPGAPCRRGPAEGFRRVITARALSASSSSSRARPGADGLRHRSRARARPQATGAGPRPGRTPLAKAGDVGRSQAAETCPKWVASSGWGSAAAAYLKEKVQEQGFVAHGAGNSRGRLLQVGHAAAQLRGRNGR
jgi:hypothetical protein